MACAAAIATLDVIRDEKLVENARVVGAVLAGGLEKVAAGNPAIGDVRGLGLMLGHEFVTADGQPDPAAARVPSRRPAERGLLLLTCGPFGNVVRMIPALVVTEEQVEEALTVSIFSGMVRLFLVGGVEVPGAGGRLQFDLVSHADFPFFDGSGRVLNSQRDTQVRKDDVDAELVDLAQSRGGQAQARVAFSLSTQRR